MISSLKSLSFYYDIPCIQVRLRRFSELHALLSFITCLSVILILYDELFFKVIT
jgi:hypothetical protein